MKLHNLELVHDEPDYKVFVIGNGHRLAVSHILFKWRVLDIERADQSSCYCGRYFRSLRQAVRHVYNEHRKSLVKILASA